MSQLNTLVADKLSQWDTEALLFCAAHGHNGGLFDVYRWANGSTMARSTPTPCYPVVSAWHWPNAIFVKRFPSEPAQSPLRRD